MRNQKGFTLIELLVVIAIIGLLATVIVVSLTSPRQKSRDAKRLADIKSVITGLEEYASDNGGSYPTAATVQNLGAGAYVELSNAVGGFTAANPAPVPSLVYLLKISADPLAGNYTYTCQIVAPATTCTKFSIGFSLEGKVNDLIAGPHTATPDGIQ